MILSKDELMQVQWMIKNNNFPDNIGNAIRDYIADEHAKKVSEYAKQAAEWEAVCEAQWKVIEYRRKKGLAEGDPFWEFMSLDLTDKKFIEKVDPLKRRMLQDERYKHLWEVTGE